jgi:hypothetical protein
MGGNDVIYGGPGDDSPLWGEGGEDVIYGGMAMISWPDPRGLVVPGRCGRRPRLL